MSDKTKISILAICLTVSLGFLAVVIVSLVDKCHEDNGTLIIYYLFEGGYRERIFIYFTGIPEIDSEKHLISVRNKATGRKESFDYSLMEGFHLYADYPKKEKL